MVGLGVGTAVVFLVGNKCLFCWRGVGGVLGKTGESVEGNFGVAPLLILYWCIF